MPTSLIDLEKKILDLNSAEQPFKIAKVGGQIIAEWNIVDAKWIELFGKAGMKDQYKLILSFNENIHTVKTSEEMQTIEWDGAIPKLGFSVKKFKGTTYGSFKKGGIYGINEDLTVGKIATYDFNTNKIKDPILAVIKEAGWYVQSGTSGNVLGLIIGGVVLFIVLVFGFQLLVFFNVKSRDEQSTKQDTPKQTESTRQESTGSESRDTESNTDSFAADTESGKTTKFGSTQVGLGMDSQDKKISNPTSEIPATAEAIYIKFDFDEVLEGDTLETYLEYLDDGSTGFEKNGKIDDSTVHSFVLDYHLKDPTQKWPVGRYAVYVKAGSGDSTIANFEVVE